MEGFDLVFYNEKFEEDPYKDINWIKSRTKIVNSQGKVIFDEEIEFPDTYSENEISVIADKYLCNRAKKKETSIKELFDRVSKTIGDSGYKQGYFKSLKEKEIFINKLRYYQVHRYFAFNSPVYFNVGLQTKPIASACFILEMDDNINSIYDNIKLETLIFKQGAGSGQNMSRIRASCEQLSSGGYASGPVSFLKVADINGGVIKSGGKLRRAAKLVVLNVDHPDIEDFINVKIHEEKKLKTLILNGIKPYNGTIMDEGFFQNTNISVGVTDAFMEAVKYDENWKTRFRTDESKIHKSYKARKIFQDICKAAWEVADPGLMFLDNINKWNTVLNDGKIESSNPCGEFLFLNNSSCNLASINLIKFFEYDEETGEFKFLNDLFIDVVETVILAQDIIVDMAHYPSPKIQKNAHEYRPLGLGYTNLGGLLMWLGFPYDSDQGREFASNITALLTGYAYLMSNKIANKKGSFVRFEHNKESMYKVLSQHIDEVYSRLRRPSTKIIEQVNQFVFETWDSINDLILEDGKFRNAAVTLLAPTGTISFLMGAVTTGIEPEFSHVKYKQLTGVDKIVTFTHNLLREAVLHLVKDSKKVDEILQIVLKEGSFKNAPYLDENQKRIFDTANSADGYGIIEPLGHIKMVAAVQPFLSMGISKTVNLPNSATVKDVEQIYMTAWELGLKGITVYRDGTKVLQPLLTKVQNNQVFVTPKRRPLPNNRKGRIHKFRIGNTKGYILCGEYEDGNLGEIFINISKQGSTLSGLIDAFGILVSIALQYGIPLKHLVRKMMNQRFEPMGFTSNPDIRTATSIIDYIARFVGLTYLDEKDQIELGLKNPNLNGNHNSFINTAQSENNSNQNGVVNNIHSDDAEPCPECGHLMRRLGTCMFCSNCGFNGGACG